MTFNQSGFSLVEWILAVFITLIVMGTALTLAGGAQRAFYTQPEAADVHQRLRVAVDALKRDLVMAGAGTYAGPAAGPLSDFLAPILPYRAFGAGSDPVRGVFFTRDAVSFLYVPSTPAQTRLAGALSPGALEMAVETPPNCPPVTDQHVCGFGSGTRAIVYDAAGHWDVFSVDGAVNESVTLQHRGPQSIVEYDVGSFVSEVRLGTYYYKGDSFQLMRYDGWATDLPVVDEVVGLEFRYFGDAEPPLLTGMPLEEGLGPWTTYGPAPPAIGVGRPPWPPGENCTFAVVDGVHVPRLSTFGSGGSAQVELASTVLTDGPWCPDPGSPTRFDADLLRVRRIHVAIRIQSALAALRGPAGVLFRRAGTARASDRFVPDAEVHFDVTPRNMNLGR